MSPDASILIFHYLRVTYLCVRETVRESVIREMTQWGGKTNKPTMSQSTCYLISSEQGNNTAHRSGRSTSARQKLRTKGTTKPADNEGGYRDDDIKSKRWQH